MTIYWMNTLVYLLISFLTTTVLTVVSAGDEERQLPTVLIIGASGAIGKSLTATYLKNGHKVIAGLRRTPLPPDIASHPLLTSVFGVDCQEASSIESVFANRSIDIVWNLAAPLSVETASDPGKAYDVVVGGMERILNAMRNNNVPRICFSDSIGSYGYESPRTVGARWLVENPLQDPGSDYGRQKRRCRELLHNFVEEDREKRSSRFAVIPGVLHTDESWGAGTTEYALDAVAAAKKGETFISPVEINATLPMIFRENLIEGLYKLSLADTQNLKEPDGGYALAGFSFTAGDLYDALKKRTAGKFRVVMKDREDLLATSPAAEFARLWPDYLSKKEAERDFGFVVSLEGSGSEVGLEGSVVEQVVDVLFGNRLDKQEAEF